MFEGLPDSAQRAQMSDTEIAEAVTEWTRAVACAGAHRLLFIGELTTRKYDADWEVAEEGSDNWDATAAEVSTASGISHGRAGTDMEVGIALTARLPKIAALLLAGQISEYLARRITKRTELIQDPELLAKVEDAIAERAIKWGALSQKNLDAAIDLWVDRFDPGALKHTRARVRGRGVDVVNSQDGITEILLRLRGADAALLIRRITLMAQGVCKDDPRTLAQRKADAHGALGAGYFHLACECGNPTCDAAADDGRASSVTVYIYAEKESLAAQPDPLMDGQDPPGDPRPAGEPWPPNEPVPAPTPAVEEESAEVGEVEPGSALQARPESQAEAPPHRQAEATDVQDGPHQPTPVSKAAVAEPDAVVAEQDSPVSADGSPAESTAPAGAPEDPPGDDPPDDDPSEGDTPPDPPPNPPPPPGPPPAQAPESPPPASTPGRPTPPPDSPAPPAPPVPSSPPAGLIVGYGIVPAPLLAALITRGATVRHLTPPRTDPEARYRPSVKLDEWVRARDLTCRFPNCDRPAEYCDWDHTVPWPAGPTHASGGKLLCRKHHQLKTFDSGWSDVQHPDGTVVWTTPSGQTHTTKPGATLFFPNVDTTSAPIDPGSSTPNSRDKKLKKPTRQRSHAKQRAYRIKAERALNDAHVAENKHWPF